MAVLGSVVLATAVLSAVFAPWITKADPTEIDLRHRLTPPAWLAGGTSAHLLGTDHLGRDVLSRTLYGGRISLLIGFTTVMVAGGIGVVLGMVSGYFGGITDNIVMRVVDIQQSFPFLALAIAVAAVIGPGVENTILILGVGSWILFARVVRGEVLSLREKEYIEGARAVGASDLRIMFRHILPNIVSPVVVLATFSFALMIVLEASLSFLGLGVQPPASTWGLMLSESRDYLEVAWWLPTFPGLAIVITVLGANLLGDWLRDVLDPRLRTV
jgi:peptide/nickel transport system permease protein